jgi:hypothetical protein
MNNKHRLVISVFRNILLNCSFYTFLWIQENDCVRPVELVTKHLVIMNRDTYQERDLFT